MKLTCLGVNGPFPAANGATSGYLLSCGKAHIQLDLGSGTLSALTAMVPPEDLTALMLSHWHFDHACDVLPLIYRMESLCAQGHEPLHVYGPVDESSPIRQAVKGTAAMVLHDLLPGDELELGGMQVRIGQARHPVPAVMFRFTHEGRTFCYTGDTNEVDGLAEFVRGADLLLADGLFPARLWAEGKPHLSAEKVALLARDNQVGQFVITHLNPALDPEELLREARAIRIDAHLAARFATYTV